MELANFIYKSNLEQFVQYFEDKVFCVKVGKLGCNPFVDVIEG